MEKLFSENMRYINGTGHFHERLAGTCRGQTKCGGNSDNLTLSTDFIRDSVQLDAWWYIAGRQDAGYKLANAGYKVVLCPLDYFLLRPCL